MGIFSRIGDIINANIIHMLDKSEDPEKMVRLMIQEMEDTLVEVKSSAAKIIADQRMVDRQIEGHLRDETRWMEKAELALQNQRDDLARGALVERSKLAEKRASLEHHQKVCEESLVQFRKDISALEEKLEDAKGRQKQIVMRKRAAAGQNEILRTLEHAKSGAGAFSKFEQFERDIDRLEGHTDALRMGETAAAGLAKELDDMQRSAAVESELASLRARVSKEKV